MESERYILRGILPSDVQNIYLGLSHPEVIKYYGVSYESLEATQEQMQWYANLEENNTGKWWAIVNKQNQDEFIGAIGFNDVDFQNQTSEIGFWLLPQYWGKSIVREVIPLVLEYGFEQMSFSKIMALVETENANCIRVLKHLQFQLEKTLTDCEIKNDRLISLVVYSMTSERFLQLKK